MFAPILVLGIRFLGGFFKEDTDEDQTRQRSLCALSTTSFSAPPPGAVVEYLRACCTPGVAGSPLSRFFLSQQLLLLDGAAARLCLTVFLSAGRSSSACMHAKDGVAAAVEDERSNVGDEIVTLH